MSAPGARAGGGPEDWRLLVELDTILAEHGVLPAWLFDEIQAARARTMTTCRWEIEQRRQDEEA